MKVHGSSRFVIAGCNLDAENPRDRLSDDMRISAKSALSPKREDAQKLKIHVSEKANFFVKSCENLTLTKMIKFEYGNLVPRTHTHKRNSPGSPAYKKRGEI